MKNTVVQWSCGRASTKCHCHWWLTNRCLLIGAGLAADKPGECWMCEELDCTVDSGCKAEKFPELKLLQQR